MEYGFSRKLLGLLPRVNHFVDWCRSEDRPYLYDCVEKSSGKELWLNLFLLDPSGSCRVLQPYPNFDTDCSLEDLCQNSILLLIFVFALEHFGTVFVTGTYWNRKKNPSSEGLPAHCWKKNRKYSCCKSCMKKNGSTSEKEEWRRLEGKNPTKWHWEKGSWCWGLAKIEALQNGSGILYVLKNHECTGLIIFWLNCQNICGSKQVTGTTIL